MIQKLVFVIAWTIFATAITLPAAPTPSPAPATGNSAVAESEKPQRQTRSKKGRKSQKKSALKITPAAPLPLGWSVLNGEWVHSDGYKYVNGEVIRTGAQTHKTPPKPPSKAALKAAAGANRPAPTPPPNSAAAKAAEIQRNKMPSRPASQTGSHL